MPLYKKKAQIVEAISVTDALATRLSDLPNWLLKQYECGNVLFTYDRVRLRTENGWGETDKNHMLICGSAGEVASCSIRAFDAAYEPLDPEEAARYPTLGVGMLSPVPPVLAEAMRENTLALNELVAVMRDAHGKALPKAADLPTKAAEVTVERKAPDAIQVTAPPRPNKS